MKYFFLALLCAGMSTITITHAQFADVPEQHSYAAAITDAQKRGIVEGYTDGTYRPEETINRAEFLKIMMEGSKNLRRDLMCTMQYHAYSDVPAGIWYDSYLQEATCAGVIGGHPDGSFRGSGPVNYAEAAKILVEAYQLPQPMFDFVPGMPVPNWYVLYIVALQDTQAQPRADIQPHDLLTRGEMAYMVYQIEQGKNPASSCEAEMHDATLLFPQLGSQFQTGALLDVFLQISPEMSNSWSQYDVSMPIIRGKHFKYDTEFIRWQIQLPDQKGSYPLLITERETGCVLVDTQIQITTSSELPAQNQVDIEAYDTFYMDDVRMMEAQIAVGSSLDGFSYMQIGIGEQGEDGPKWPIGMLLTNMAYDGGMGGLVESKFNHEQGQRMYTALLIPDWITKPELRVSIENPIEAMVTANPDWNWNEFMNNITQKHPLSLIPSTCTLWYDGCNNCGVENGEMTYCTLRACVQQDTPKCLEYETPDCVIDGSCI